MERRSQALRGKTQSNVINPLGPNIKRRILLPTDFSVFLCNYSWEKLIKHQDISSSVIISFILITCMFQQVD